MPDAAAVTMPILFASRMTLLRDAVGRSLEPFATASPRKIAARTGVRAHAGNRTINQPLQRLGLLGRRSHIERPLRSGRIGDFEEQRADHRRHDTKEGQSVEAAGIAAGPILDDPD